MVTHNIHFHEELSTHHVFINHHKPSFLFERVSNVIILSSEKLKESDRRDTVNTNEPRHEKKNILVSELV